MNFKLKSAYMIVVFAILMMIIMKLSVFANEIATVNVNALNVRAEMSTNANVIGIAYRGEKLFVVSEQDGWLKVNYKDTYGFVVSQFVTLSSIPQDEIEMSESGFVTASILNVRSQPSFNSEQIGRLVYGDIVRVTGSVGDFYKVDIGGQTAYVAKEYIEIGTYAQLSSRSAALRLNRSSQGALVVEKAKEYLGVRYVYGGSSPSGFDCSGFTSYVYSQMGHAIARTAAGQANNGVKITKEQLLPGDLVFFNTYGGISHVGIYVGNGQMIHAPNSGRTVSYDSINSGYYSSRYVTARRIVE